MPTFIVHGIPQPQGSTSAFQNKQTGKIVVTSANPKLKKWRTEVGKAAQIAMADSAMKMWPKGIPVRVTAEFYFNRPESTKEAISFKTTKPDLDKLLRAILDGMEGVVYEHDAQVATESSRKRFTNVEPHVHISVERDF